MAKFIAHLKRRTHNFDLDIYDYRGETVWEIEAEGPKEAWDKVKWRIIEQFIGSNTEFPYIDVAGCMDFWDRIIVYGISTEHAGMGAPIYQQANRDQDRLKAQIYKANRRKLYEELKAEFEDL